MESEGVDQREVDQIRGRVDGHTDRLANVEQRMAGVESYQNEHYRRLEHLDQTAQALDTQVVKLTTQISTSAKILSAVGTLLAAFIPILTTALVKYFGQ